MKLIRGRVFRRYMFSYLSVALAICLFLGVTLTLSAGNQLRQAEINLYQSRMYLTADFIERQIGAMEDIRLEIQTNRVYQPFYLKQNVVNDIEMLKSFSRLTSYSGWVNEYYLWYRETDKVFGSNAVYSSRIFFDRLMGGMDEGDFAPFLETAGEAHLLVLPSRADSVLVSVPFYFGSAKAHKGEAVLLFLVRLNTLKQTVWEMVGVGRGSSFSFSYNGRTILGGDASAKDVLEAVGPDGKARLTMSAPSIAAFDYLSSFWKATLMSVVAAALIGGALAAYTAWRSYQPIHRLYTKYADLSGPHSNELQSIEKVLSDTLEINAFSQKRLDEQLTRLEQQQAWLKQQTVMMIISGSSASMVKRQIQALGLDLGRELFAILFIHIREGQPTEGWLRDMESFADAECSLYATEMQAKREYALLINCEEESQCEVLLELLADALTARGLTAQMQLSRACTDIDGLASASIEALSARPVMVPDESDLSSDKQESDGLRRMLTLARNGDTSEALSMLDAMLDRANRRGSSYLMRVFMLNMLYQRLLCCAVQMGATVAPELNDGLSSADDEAMCDRMRRLVVSVSAGVDATDEMQDGARGGEAAAYIREHCLNADISLSSTAQALGVSTKQVTRLLRTGIGMTFKEYLLNLRMEAAKKILLQENLSIAETAEKVGYFNISHFIKCFKSYTGVTPGEWKKAIK